MLVQRARTSTSRSGSMVPLATTIRSIRPRSTFAVGAGPASPPPPASAARRPRVGRERARGVRRGGVAREEEGLAAAAAQVPYPLGAAPAGLAHPPFAAEGAHAGRPAPAPRERAPAGRAELEAGDLGGRVAGQHAAVRRHDDRAAGPAAHARLRAVREVVR